MNIARRGLSETYRLLTSCLRLRIQDLDREKRHSHSALVCTRELMDRECSCYGNFLADCDVKGWQRTAVISGLLSWVYCTSCREEPIFACREASAKMRHILPSRSTHTLEICEFDKHFRQLSLASGRSASGMLFPLRPRIA